MVVRSLAELSAHPQLSVLSSLNAYENEDLDGLELADGYFHDLKKPIDVLVEAEYYWNIVTRDTVVGDVGPVALAAN